MKRINWRKVLLYGIWLIACGGIVTASVYPFASDYLLARKQSAQIEAFDKKDKKQSRKDFLQAFYRQHSKSQPTEDPFSQSEKKSKNSVNVAAESLKTIAVLSVPKIHEVLPVFDNTSSVALDNGVGLLENTDPPIGGKGHHSVLTGHSGLSLNRLFTDLNKVKMGDKFYIKVNHEVHAYQVDQIKKVTPDDLRYFATDPQQDYVTLVTCTPLFINSHRLLVRGHRIPYNPQAKIPTEGGLTPLAKMLLAIAGSLSVIGIGFAWVRHRKNLKERRG